MFHRAIDLSFLKGTTLEVLFETGELKRFDMSNLFAKYSNLEVLKDRSLFLSGKLLGYGIIWNDDCDIETETIYQDGYLVRIMPEPVGLAAGNAVRRARADAGISQMELSLRSDIDQGDISRIERGLSNPSVETLERIARAMNMKLEIKIGQ